MRDECGGGVLTGVLTMTIKPKNSRAQCVACSASRLLGVVTLRVLIDCITPDNYRCRSVKNLSTFTRCSSVLLLTLLPRCLHLSFLQLSFLNLWLHFDLQIHMSLCWEVLHWHWDLLQTRHWWPSRRLQSFHCRQETEDYWWDNLVFILIPWENKNRYETVWWHV